MLKAKVKTLYCELLGESLKQQLIEKKIPQNKVSYYFDDDVRLISAPTISQILKGKRNITLDVANAFQDTLGLPNVKSFFLPSLNFCELLITQIIELILTDEYFKDSHTRKLFQTKEKVIQKELSFLAEALNNFFPDFPQEETSYQISESLTEWLLEFVVLVSKL